MTPAPELSVLGKVLKTFPLPPVYNFAFRWYVSLED